MAGALKINLHTSALLTITSEFTTKVYLPSSHALIYSIILLGSGKNHKDAASVRTVHSIPNTCGIYYFEVQLISKGRDGLVTVVMGMFLIIAPLDT